MQEKKSGYFFWTHLTSFGKVFFVSQLAVWCCVSVLVTPVRISLSQHRVASEGVNSVKICIVLITVGGSRLRAGVYDHKMLSRPLFFTRPRLIPVGLWNRPCQNVPIPGVCLLCRLACIPIPVLIYKLWDQPPPTKKKKPVLITSEANNTLWKCYVSSPSTSSVFRPSLFAPGLRDYKLNRYQFKPSTSSSLLANCQWSLLSTWASLKCYLGLALL